MEAKRQEGPVAGRMRLPQVLFLPGNGHAPVRLEGVRAEMLNQQAPFELIEATYGRAGSYADLLEGLATTHADWHSAHPTAPIYATGIGGLVALSLRARGVFPGHPLVIQGAVLWGLEKRWFPRIMRLPGMPHLLTWAFRRSRVQARFTSRHFLTEPTSEWSRRFFAGYDDAAAFAAWFDWLTPALLRELETQLRSRPEALANLEAWWGERDTVVGPEELRITERALRQSIPLRPFPAWAHYPMIDDPAGWVREVSRVVEAAGELP